MFPVDMELGAKRFLATPRPEDAAHLARATIPITYASKDREPALDRLELDVHDLCVADGFVDPWTEVSVRLELEFPPTAVDVPHALGRAYGPRFAKLHASVDATSGGIPFRARDFGQEEDDGSHIASAYVTLESEVGCVGHVARVACREIARNLGAHKSRGSMVARAWLNWPDVTSNAVEAYDAYDVDVDEEWGHIAYRELEELRERMRAKKAELYSAAFSSPAASERIRQELAELEERVRESAVQYFSFAAAYAVSTTASSEDATVLSSVSGQSTAGAREDAETKESHRKKKKNADAKRRQMARIARSRSSV